MECRPLSISTRYAFDINGLTDDPCITFPDTCHGVEFFDPTDTPSHYLVVFPKALPPHVDHHPSKPPDSSLKNLSGSGTISLHRTSGTIRVHIISRAMLCPT